MRGNIYYISMDADFRGMSILDIELGRVQL